jgi:predicted transposase YdaD
VESPHTLSQRLIHLLLTTSDQAPAEAQAILSPALDSALKPLILGLVETILVYKLPRLSREEIQTMLGLTQQDLKNSRFYQEASAEGRQEGHQEGRQVGRQEGEALLLLHLLERRFAPLDDTLRERVQNADTETLLVWGERVLTAKSVEEVLGE